MNKKTIKILANTSALVVPLILVTPFLFRYTLNWIFTPEQYLSYAIGLASPLAALAGYLFVYLSFIHQQEQFERQSFESILLILMDRLKTDGKEIFPTHPKKGSTPELKNFSIEYSEKFIEYHVKSIKEMNKGGKRFKITNYWKSLFSEFR